MKIAKKSNFIKLTQRRGVSLIVLIVTIIVVIILAAAVILTLSSNNPIDSAREVKFKQDIRNIQDELFIYLSSKYSEDLDNFDSTELNLSKEVIEKELLITKGYQNILKVEKGKLKYIGDNEKEKEWFLSVVGLHIPEEWRDTIEYLTSDEVPIPKGFTYVTGTKTTGTVIQDDKGNEFVWVPATETTYVKDLAFPGNCTPKGDDDLPTGITDETYDVKKYGGFYIARYEAGIPQGDTTPSNKTGKPVSKKGAVVWTNINYINAKASAESMVSNDYVQTGLMTGTAWDATCHFLEDEVSSLTDSGKYGNYFNSTFPADVTGHGKKQVAGYSDKWSVKNIYDMAGNVWEWTNETFSSFCIVRGGAYGWNSAEQPVSYRGHDAPYESYDEEGFRTRLYIK